MSEPGMNEPVDARTAFAHELMLLVNKFIEEWEIDTGDMCYVLDAARIELVLDALDCDEEWDEE